MHRAFQSPRSRRRSMSDETGSRAACWARCASGKTVWERRRIVSLYPSPCFPSAFYFPIHLAGLAQRPFPLFFSRGKGFFCSLRIWNRRGGPNDPRGRMAGTFLLQQTVFSQQIRNRFAQILIGFLRGAFPGDKDQTVSLFYRRQEFGKRLPHPPLDAVSGHGVAHLLTDGKSYPHGSVPSTGMDQDDCAGTAGSPRSIDALEFFVSLERISSVHVFHPGSFCEKPKKRTKAQTGREDAVTVAPARQPLFLFFSVSSQGSTRKFA